jgi:hypothetical protein
VGIRLALVGIGRQSPSRSSPNARSSSGAMESSPWKTCEIGGCSHGTSAKVCIVVS